MLTKCKFEKCDVKVIAITQIEALSSIAG
jgi:hypothetical protein